MPWVRSGCPVRTITTRASAAYLHARQPPSAHGPLEPALRESILLITILLITLLVAFLEATAQQLRPMQPPVVMGFSGITRTNSTAQVS